MSGTSVCVPPSHRLDGGSLGGAARSGGEAAAFLGPNAPHNPGRPAFFLPDDRASDDSRSPPRQAHVLDFFTTPEVFGDGFESTRRAMALATEAFCREWNSNSSAFLAIWASLWNSCRKHRRRKRYSEVSTSYRLNLVASPLAGTGPDHFSRIRLGVEPTPGEADRL